MCARICLSVLTLMLITAAPLSPDTVGEETALQELGRKYLVTMFEAFPVYATEMGDYSRDYLRYPEFSKRSFNRLESALEGIRRDLKKVKWAQLVPDAKIDYLLLESNINRELLYLEHSVLLRNNPKVFSSTAVNGVYYLASSASHSDSLKLDFILERLADLPRFLGSAKDVLNKPPRLWLVLAEEEAEQGIQFFSETAAYYLSRFPAQADVIKQRFDDAAVALEQFVDFVDALELLEYSDFAFGKENYDQLLVTEYFLDFDSDSLLRLGEALLDQAVREYDSIRTIVDTLPARDDAVCFVPKSFNREDVLEYYQWEIDQSRAWVQRADFATVPPDLGECVPVETPEFLANIMSIAYQPPGPFAPVARGFFYVNPLPDSLDFTSRSAYFKYCLQRGFRRLTVHEAYPGHHLQLQMASRHRSLIRRFQSNTLLAEGWALYCEEAVYEQGFYGNDLRAYLNVLDGVLFRAARIILDVKLHTGQFSYQDAVGWMAGTLNASLEFAESEVARYTLTPTTPMSYLLGKLLLEELKESYRTQQGDQFSLKAFHDMILSEGSLPPTLLRRKLEGEFGR